MKKIISPKGSVLIEVVISIFIFSLGLVATGSLIISSINVNMMSRNRIIALNLTREGIEAVRSMRDTNWMTNSSSNLRACWNFWDDTNEDGAITVADTACSANAFGQNDHPMGKDKDGNLIKDYIVDFNSNHRWILLEEEKGSSGSWNTTHHKTPVLYKDSDGLYTHDSNSGANEATAFSRKITIEYLDSSHKTDGLLDMLFPDGAKNLDNRILVTSTVSWKYKNNPYSVVFAEILTDYYGREGSND